MDSTGYPTKPFSFFSKKKSLSVQKKRKIYEKYFSFGGDGPFLFKRKGMSLNPRPPAFLRKEIFFSSTFSF